MHVKKSYETEQKLYQATKTYLNVKRDNGNDYKKVLDAEMKYKLAYLKYEDSKVKTIDLENSVQTFKTKIKQTQVDIDEKLKDLGKESEQVFL